MNRIKYIIFDYGGVISKPQDKNIVYKMLRLLNLEINEFKELYTKHRYNYDAGIINGREYWQKTLEGNCNGELDFDEIIKLDVKSWLDENDAILNDIKNLGKQSFHIGILSNMTFDTLIYLQDREWFQLIPSKVFSCRVNVCKPDQKIYQILAEKLGADYQEILFIDDSKENILAAEELGINTIHYVDYDTFQQQLKNQYGIKSMNW